MLDLRPDRFSYEALNSAERLTKPMLKQGGEWRKSTGRPRWNMWPTA
jgi:predicted molibdopterin-dependent oxidoreductase YjgC